MNASTNPPVPVDQKLAVGMPEAAKIVSISRVKLYREMKLGKLKTFKIGKRRLVKISELKAWLDAAAAA